MITNITAEQLNDMKNIKTLSEIQDIEIDAEQPIIGRFEKYLSQIKNPYCFLCGENVVKIEFSDNDKSLEQSLENYLINLKNKIFNLS